MAETVRFRSESNQLIDLDLPLSEIMQEKVTKGYLRRVNEDGTLWVEPAEGGSDLTNGVSPRPPQAAQKSEWVGYAVLVGNMAPDEAEAMTKQDLIDRFGKD